MLAAVLACDFSASTANLQDARTAKDPEGTQPATVFAQDEVFYAVAELSNAPDDTVAKAVWTAVAAEGFAPNIFLDETELTSSDATLKFELSNTDLWPIGTYKVELFLNDELDTILEFQVQ